MRIDLQWAMTGEESGWRPCELCEADFEPRSIIVSIDPYGFEICEECTRALRQRAERGGVEVEWPTWEEYQAALREHPEPMMSEAELRRAEELGLYEDLYKLAQLGD